MLVSLWFHRSIRKQQAYDSCRELLRTRNDQWRKQTPGGACYRFTAFGNSYKFRWVPFHFSHYMARCFCGGLFSA
eukprot:3082953-Amphidinium_carterae.1